MSIVITLKVGGDRTSVGVDEAKAIRDRFRKEIDEAGAGAVVRKLDISCRQWSAESVEILRDIFQEVAPTLYMLDIADTIAGLKTEEGLGIMELWAQCFAQARLVEEMDLSDNAMGPRALEKVAPLLNAPNLKTLRFNNCGFSAETIPQLFEALGEGGATRLAGLELNRNMIGHKGCELLANLLPACKNLLRFTFCGCRPEKLGSKFLAAGLKKMAGDKHGLKELELEDGDLGSGEEEEDGIHDLGKALEHFPNLTLLNLSDAGDLEESGVGIVAQALLNSKCKLVYLDMSGCVMGPDGAQAMQEYLQANKATLKVLKLESNELENDGLKNILTAFEGSSNGLTHLHLEGNEFDEGAIDALLNAGDYPNLKLLSLKDNIDLEDVDDDKKQSLRDKFASAKVCIEDDDEVESAETEKKDADVDDLTRQMAGL